MKSRKGFSNSKKNDKNIEGLQKTSQSIIASSKVVPNSNPKLAKQIEKLKKQIESTNDDIKQTQKLLDTDLFLKKKKMEYAKNINAQYETQKKLREEKLYKKFNRDKKDDGKDSKAESKVQSNMLFFKTNNIAVFTPTAIVKSLTNQAKNQQSQWIRAGHIFKDQQCSDLELLRREEQQIFSKLYRSGQNLKVKYDGDSEAKHLVWKNIQEVCENCLEIQTLPSSPGQHQLLVGASEDEQILNALCLMTKDLSSLLFAQTQNTFSAKLNCPEKPLTIVTDKKILVRQFTHKNVNLGARCQNSNKVWPTLVQKCSMKVQHYRGYPAGSAKSTLLQSIFTLYGLDAEIIPITNQNIIKENFHLVLGHLLQQGRIGFMNVGRTKKSCYEGRVYILQSIREEVAHKSKNEEKLEIMFKIKDPWRGKLLDSSNRNKFNVLELLANFNLLVILKSYPQKWSCLRISFSYFSNGAIGLSNNEWTKNPQYLFTITKKMSIRIVLRKSGRNIQENNTINSENIYGFLLFQNKQAQNKIQCMKMDALIVKTKSNDFQEASYSGQLPKGNYIVIPYSTYKSEKAYQFYTIDFIVEKQNCIDFGKARIHEWEYLAQKGARLGEGEKIIQSLESKQKYEKPKIQKVQLPKLFAQKITKKILQELQLNLYEGSQLKHFFMPGFIKKLLINTSINVENSVKNMKKQTKKEEDFVHEEISKQEQAENLSVLLGYDVLSDDINQGQMREYQQQSVGIYDFRDFQLGEDGLISVLECLCQHPQIIDLDLSGNNLGDSSITYLCYYLQKSNRVELRELKLLRNPIGFNGKCALQGLKTVYPKVNISLTGIKLQ